MNRALVIRRALKGERAIDHSSFKPVPSQHSDEDYTKDVQREESSMSREAAIFSLDDSFPDKKYKYCKGNPVIVQEVPVAYEPVTRQETDGFLVH